MKDGSPFGIGGLWENWKEPASGEWICTFVIITTDANELVADIHDRMPLILRLIKIAARVVKMKTMIRVHLPTSCPAQDILRFALGRIPRLVS